MKLDDLPLDVLLAMQDAILDPTGEGRDRASARAADQGFYVRCTNELDDDGRIILGDPPPVEMDPAEPGVDAVVLRFGNG